VDLADADMENLLFLTPKTAFFQMARELYDGFQMAAKSFTDNTVILLADQDYYIELEDVGKVWYLRCPYASSAAVCVTLDDRKRVKSCVELRIKFLNSFPNQHIEQRQG
jgi:hypothetical protein